MFPAIEKLLLDNGAIDFSYEIYQGQKVALRFSLVLDTETLQFRMPAKIEKVKTVLLREAVNQREVADAPKQAYQTTWATIRDWLGVQFAMILMDGAEPAEIFLPYLIVDGQKKTLFQEMREQKMLGRPRVITEIGANNG